MSDYSFVIIHFGNNIKYLEYELYFLMNLSEFTKYDICYLYSIQDTPIDFVEKIKKLNINIKTIPYNDKGVSYNIENTFKSSYTHFNTLRTCNFIYAYLLTQYKKVCILESDMVILKNIDHIFKLKCPSVFYTMNKIKSNEDNKNNLIILNQKKMIDNCYKGTPINGGVFLIKPNKEEFKKLKIKIKQVIKNNCIYPNETLIVAYIKPLYNMPIKYNFSHYYFDDFNKFQDIYILHYNQSKYKPIDIIKNNYIQKKGIKKKIISVYKKSIYDKFYNKIKNILNK